MSERRFEVLAMGQWHPIAFGQIRIGETFRAFEADGTMVKSMGSTVFRAAETGIGNDGRRFIESEAVVITTSEAADTLTAITAV